MQRVNFRLNAVAVFIVMVAGMMLTVLSLIGCTQLPENKSINKLYQGNIHGYDYEDHTIELNQGDRLSVQLDTNPLEVIIVSPITKQLYVHSEVIIDSSSEYILRVLMPRSAARKNLSINYQLIVTVTPSK